jgi:hypothetical protein
MKREHERMPKTREFDLRAAYEIMAGTVHFRFIIPSDVLYICLQKHTRQNYSTIRTAVFDALMLGLRVPTP